MAASGKVAKAASKSKKSTNGTAGRSVAKESKSTLPDIGSVLKRMRLQRQLSIQDVADGSGLSQSFLSMVERGDSDISLGRLSKLADFFGHDIGSLLGYSTRLAKPHFVSGAEREIIDRGPGIEYEIIRLPGLEMEMNVVKLAAKSSVAEAISHEGFDVLYVSQGEVVLCLGDEEYPMHEGQCVVYSAVYPHRNVNRSRKPAVVVGVTTGRMG
jgi:transcriptional regulator with XRE-family HTH domain